MTIYKYPIQTTDVQYVQMPKGAKPLCVQVQNGGPCIWAMVDPDAPMVVKKIAIAGTGNRIADESGIYLGTYQMHGGSLIFHVFTFNEPQISNGMKEPTQWQ